MTGSVAGLKTQPWGRVESDDFSAVNIGIPAGETKCRTAIDRTVR